MKHTPRWRLGLLAVTGVLAAVPSGAATHKAGSAADYRSAMSRAVAGDTVQLTADITLPVDTAVKAGTTLDLNGKTVTFPTNLPDGRPSRGFSLEGGNVTVQNGTIDQAKWALYAFNPASNFTFRNLKIRRTKAFLKLAAGGKGLTDNILVEDCDVVTDGAPWTIMDLGPGDVGKVTIRRYRSQTSVTSNNTASDGIAVEDGKGPIVMEDVLIDGSVGDGIDLKNWADISLTRCVVKNIARNGIKTWGRGGDTTSTATLNDCRIINTGLEAFTIAAGNLVARNLYVETGSIAANWGSGKAVGTGLAKQEGVGEGPCNVRVYDSSFLRVNTSPYIGTLMSTEGGDGAPVTEPVTIYFEGCTFSTHDGPKILGTKPNSRYPVLMVADVKAGKWPPYFVRCRYIDEVGPTGGTTTGSTDALQISVGSSNMRPKPGEKVTLTTICLNPTDRLMKAAVLRQSVPEQMVMVAGSAQLDDKPVTASVVDGKFNIPLGDMPPNATRTFTVVMQVK